MRLVWRVRVSADGSPGPVLQGVQAQMGTGGADPHHRRHCLPLLHSMYDCGKYRYALLGALVKRRFYFVLLGLIGIPCKMWRVCNASQRRLKSKSHVPVSDQLLNDTMLKVGI